MFSPHSWQLQAAQKICIKAMAILHILIWLYYSNKRTELWLSSRIRLHLFIYIECSVYEKISLTALLRNAIMSTSTVILHSSPMLHTCQKRYFQGLKSVRYVFGFEQPPINC